MTKETPLRQSLLLWMQAWTYRYTYSLLVKAAHFPAVWTGLPDTTTITHQIPMFLNLITPSLSCVTIRAEVCAQQDGASYQVTLTDASGNLPDARAVQRTCESAGGILGVYDDPHGNSNPSGGHSSGGMATRLALGSGTGRHSTLPTTTSTAGSSGPKVPATFRFSFVDKSYSAAGNLWAPPASSPPTLHTHSTPMHFPLRP